MKLRVSCQKILLNFFVAHVSPLPFLLLVFFWSIYPSFSLASILYIPTPLYHIIYFVNEFEIRLKFKRYLFNEYSNGILMLFGICWRENGSEQVDVIFLLWFVYVFVRNNGVILSGLKLPIILQLFFSLIIFMLVNMNGYHKTEIETILRKWLFWYHIVLWLGLGFIIVKNKSAYDVRTQCNPYDCF